MRLVLATANPDKVREIAALLGGAVELLPRPAEVGDVEETGTTLVENARLKATVIARAAGEAAVADDTGLEVDGLDGRPGVYAVQDDRRPTHGDQRRRPRCAVPVFDDSARA